jgi:hypothetical protein
VIDRTTAFVAGAVGLLFTLVVWRAGAVFEAGVRPPVLVATPIVVLAAGLAVPSRWWSVRLTVHAVAILVCTTAAVFGAGGSLDDVGAALLRGLPSALAAPWPVFVDPLIVGGLAAAAGLAAAVAVELLVARQPAPLVLVPVVVLAGLLGMLSAPAGPPSTAELVVFGCGLVAVLWLGEVRRRQVETGIDLPGSAANRRAVVAGVGVAVAAGIVGTAWLVGDLDRWNPRENLRLETSQRTEISPLSQVDGWRELDPPEVMFRAAGGADRPWTLVALTRYDGRSWMPSADYRPTGRQLRPEPDDQGSQALRVELARLRSAFLPAPADAIEVSVPVSVDRSIGGLLLERTPPEGFEFEVVVPDRRTPPGEAVDAAPAAPVLVDGAVLPPELVQLATTFTAGARDDRQRAELLAARLQRELRFDAEAPAGHSLLVLQRFLAGDQAGRAEQFVAAYALLASAVDLPVRVVVGFAPMAAGDGAVAWSSGAEAWAEVEFDDGEWVRFDPAPEGENVVAAGEGGSLAPSAAPPPTTPPTTEPPPPTTDSPQTDDEAAPDSGIGVPVAPVVGTGLVVLLVGGYASAVLALKAGRRRRRRSAPMERRVTGAFTSGVETLVDLGATPRSSATNRELVLTGATRVDGALEPLGELADLATAAVFSGSPSDEVDAEAAWVRLQSFEHRAEAEVGRLRWLRARLSLRSLRRRL